ncbi:hypothetical protein IJ579_08440 [bacterium]|nr:hypothetical protein [bacterium]
MVVSLNTDFIKSKFVYLKQKNVLAKEDVTDSRLDTPKIRNWTIGLSAASVLIGLGVLARKGKLGKTLQEFSGGKSVQKIDRTIDEIAQEISTATEHSTPRENTIFESCSATPPKMESPKVAEVLEKYSTELPETVKTYTGADIDVSILDGDYKNWFKGRVEPSLELLNKIKNRDLTILYNDAEETTQILLPFRNKSYYSFKIKGIVSQDRVKLCLRSINAKGLIDIVQMYKEIEGILNGTVTPAKYSIKNVAMYYDFHDQGAWRYNPGETKYCTDGRMLLRDVLGNKWEGTAIDYFGSKRSTTQVARALPTNYGERCQSNHWTIFLDGIIPPKTCGRLVEYLEKNVIRNPKDVTKEELPQILQATIDFMNKCL